MKKLNCFLPKFISRGGAVLNDLFKYSLEEHVVGTWIDGRPIYSKTIYIPALPNSDVPVEYKHNIENIDMCWFALNGCFAIWTTREKMSNPLPFMNYTGASIFLHDADKTVFKIKTTMDRTGLSAYVTLQYVKTTDIK